MINWLKYLRNESGKKSFLNRFIVPTAGIFFSWGFLGHLYMTNFQLNDLTPLEGRITYIDIVPEKSISQSGGTYHPLMIRLDTGSELYRLHEEFKFKFDELLNQVSEGDVVTLYKRNRTQAFLTWGRGNDIFQIDSNNTTLFKLEWMLNYKKNQMATFGIFAVICWIAYSVYWIERTRNKKVAAKSRSCPPPSKI